MPTAASGIYSSGPAELANLVASSNTFQTKVSAASEALALVRVYVVGVNPGDMTRPCAVVGWHNFRVRRGGFAAGQLQVRFEDTVAADLAADGTRQLGPDPTSAAYDFTNWVGAVLAEMMQNSEQAGRLIVQEDGIHQAEQPMRAELDEDADRYMATFTVDFGGH